MLHICRKMRRYMRAIHKSAPALSSAGTRGSVRTPVHVDNCKTNERARVFINPRRQHNKLAGTLQCARRCCEHAHNVRWERTHMCARCDDRCYTNKRSHETRSRPISKSTSNVERHPLVVCITKYNPKRQAAAAAAAAARANVILLQ